MYFKKTNIPEKGELLICTVKKILPHSIFVDLDEYEDKEGYIHISEIAPGRIRNIRDYVKEGKKIVCKVLDINQERGHIDLSLRRVPETARIQKNEDFKQEHKAEKIVEMAAKNSSANLDEIYKKISIKIQDEYGLLNNFLQAVSLNGEPILKDLSLPDNFVKELLKIVKDKIKQPEVSLSYDLTISCYQPDGINIIKDSLNKVEELSKKNNYKTKLTYISAPKYRLSIRSEDYKSAEKIASELSSIIISNVEENKGTASIAKIEK